MDDVSRMFHGAIRFKIPSAHDQRVKQDRPKVSDEMSGKEICKYALCRAQNRIHHGIVRQDKR
jgi:hypothetical protein